MFTLSAVPRLRKLRRWYYSYIKDLVSAHKVVLFREIGTFKHMTMMYHRKAPQYRQGQESGLEHVLCVQEGPASCAFPSSFSRYQVRGKRKSQRQVERCTQGHLSVYPWTSDWLLSPFLSTHWLYRPAFVEISQYSSFCFIETSLYISYHGAHFLLHLSGCSSALFTLEVLLHHIFIRRGLKIEPDIFQTPRALLIKYMY